MSNIIRDSNKIAYPAKLWVTEDTQGNPEELDLGTINSASELESALVDMETECSGYGIRCSFVGWYVNGEDAEGNRVRLSTMED